MEPSNSSFFETLQTRLLQLYMPTNNYLEATVHMTTREIYCLLQEFCEGDYNINTLAAWLNEWGFSYVETTPLRFEWLLKKKID